MRATEEGDPDTVMRDAEVAELESDRSPMISDIVRDSRHDACVMMRRASSGVVRASHDDFA